MFSFYAQISAPQPTSEIFASFAALTRLSRAQLRRLAFTTWNNWGE